VFKRDDSDDEWDEDAEGDIEDLLEEK